MCALSQSKSKKLGICLLHGNHLNAGKEPLHDETIENLLNQPADLIIGPHGFLNTFYPKTTNVAAAEGRARVRNTVIDDRKYGRTDMIAFTPELGPYTPDEEKTNIAESVKHVAEVVHEAGKKLVFMPDSGLVAKNEYANIDWKDVDVVITRCDNISEEQMGKDIGETRVGIDQSHANTTQYAMFNSKINPEVIDSFDVDGIIMLFDKREDASDILAILQKYRG